MKINKKKLKNAACVAATLVMVAYLAGALVITDRAQASARCEGMRIEVRDTGNPTFVTAHEIARELGGLAERSSGMLLRDINTEEIARRLGEIDKIESATVTLLSDRRINVTVTPLVPVYQPPGQTHRRQRALSRRRPRHHGPLRSGRHCLYARVATAPARLARRPRQDLGSLRHHD